MGAPVMTCAAMQPWFLVFLGLLALVFGLVAYMVWTRDAKPPATGGGGGSANYGRPYGIMMMFLHLSLWSMAPPLVFYIVFRIAFVGNFSFAQELACSQLSLPYTGIVFLLYFLSLLLTYEREEIKAEVRANLCTWGREDKVLVLGATQRGLYAVDALRKQRELGGDVHVVDYADDVAWVQHNLAAEGIPPRADGTYPLHTPVGHSMYGLPFEDGEFDVLLLPPGIRRAAPIADTLTPEDVRARRFSQLLEEALRVLRTDGKILYFSQLDECFIMQADLRDLGVKATVLPYRLETKIAIKFPAKMGVLEATKPSESRMNEVLCYGSIVGMASDDTGKGISNTSALLYRAVKAVVAPHHVQIILSVGELLTFAVLVVIAAALFPKTDLPTYIDTRLNSVFVGVATNYPLFCYFQRQSFSDTVYDTYGKLLVTLVVSTIITVVMSFVLSILFWIPVFVLALIIHKTGGSIAIVNIGGTLISVGIFIYSVKTFRKKGIEKSFKLRNVPQEHWAEFGL